MDRVVYTDGSFAPEVLLIGFFKKSQMPDHFPVLGFDLSGGCFPTGPSPVWPTAQASNRQYVNVGNLTVTDGSSNLLITPQLNQSDELLRTHDIFYGYDQLTADTNAIPGHSYTISLSGSDQYNAVTWPDILKLPGSFETFNPPPDAALVTLDPTKDYEIHVTAPTEPNVQTFATFYQPNTALPFICFDSQPPTGRVTVPAAMIASAPTPGYLLRGHIYHQTVEFNDGHGTRGRRIDILAISCYASPYEIAGAAGSDSGVEVDGSAEANDGVGSEAGPATSRESGANEDADTDGNAAPEAAAESEAAAD